MQIICPGCKARFSLEDSRVGAEGIKLRCNKCRTIFKVVRKPAYSPPPAVPASQIGPRIKVLIANESRAFCQAVQKVLAPEPFEVFTYNDGREAWTAIQKLVPDVVLLDVALPSMYGFEVCEEIRKSAALNNVKIILIASIYDKTRYKRSPQSLYGADDYIEKHHIPDTLAAMVNRLTAGQKPVETNTPSLSPDEEGDAVPQQLSPQELSVQEAARQELKLDEERETLPAPAVSAAPQMTEAHTKAKRLARIIVSDIILYNQGKVEEGVREGTFYALMAEDIAEGKALYRNRVPEEIRSTTSYLDDAFEELIAKKKKELSL